MITSPLFGWLAGTELLPKRFHSDEKGSGDSEEASWSISVALDDVIPLHSAGEVTWQSLQKSRALTSEYLASTDKLIDGLWGGRLDSEERTMISEELGPPPDFCMPIYMFTIQNAEAEEVVYVGKTTSSSRFIGGHAAALKLLSPEFSDYSKRIYRCSVLLFLRNEYMALEWLDSDRLAESVLDWTETLLIYALQPRLNRAKRKRPQGLTPIHIHVQNYADTGLMDNLMLEYTNEKRLFFVPSKGSHSGCLGIFRASEL